MSATEAQLDKIWEGDLLGRRKDAEYLVKVLPGLAESYQKWEGRGSYVLNVDSGWGRGKSFFMTRLMKHLQAEGYPAVYIDAWKNDFSDDPFTVVMSEIGDFIGEQAEGGKLAEGVKESFRSTLKGAGQLVLSVGSGVAVGLANRYFREVIEGVKDSLGDAAEDAMAKDALRVVEGKVGTISEDAVEKYAASQIGQLMVAKEAQKTFHDSLEEFVDKISAEDKFRPPLFVMIDELDRCRPTYAIEMLERIKHLFDVPNMVFILSTNTKELAHSVRAVYGAGFSAEKYLDRFFSRSFRLSTMDPQDFASILWDIIGVDESRFIQQYMLPSGKEFLAEIIIRSDMPLRDAERLIDILATISHSWEERFPRLDYIVMIVLIAAQVSGQKVQIADGGQVPFERAIFADDYKIQKQGRHQFEQVDVADYFRTRISKSTRPKRDWLGAQFNRPRREPSTMDGFLDNLFHEEIQAHFDELDVGFITRYNDLIEQAGRFDTGITRPE